MLKNIKNIDVIYNLMCAGMLGRKKECKRAIVRGFGSAKGVAASQMSHRK